MLKVVLESLKIWMVLIHQMLIGIYVVDVVHQMCINLKLLEKIINKHIIIAKFVDMLMM